MKLSNIHIIFLLISICFSLCACGKQVCDYCGEEKNCTEYNILGTTRMICDDCLGNPSNATSGNVLREYSQLYEDGVLTYPKVASDNEVASENTAASETSVVSEDNLSEENISASVNAATAAPTASAMSMDSFRQSLSETFSIQGFTLLPVDETNHEYVLYEGNTDLGIHFILSSSQNLKPALVVEKYASASSSDYTSVCISCALLFLNSTDYDTLGYSIYNNACQYGNYTYDGVRFLYMENSDSEVADGLPAVTFDISQ